MNTEEKLDEQLQRLAAAEKQREEKNAAILKHQETLLKAAIWRSCINCINWQEIPMSGRTMRCGLYKQTPPPNVIVNGCRDWEDDIPF